MKKSYLYIIGLIGLLLLIAGFVLGRLTTTTKTIEKVKLVNMPAVQETIVKPQPLHIEKPKVIPKVDTASIIQDYFSKKRYGEVIFENDSIGKLEINIAVQQNAIDSIRYKFQPIKVVETREIYKTKAISPFIGLHVNTLPSIGIQAGIYINDRIGIGAEYQRDLIAQKNIYGGTVFYKF